MSDLGLEPTPATMEDAVEAIRRVEEEVENINERMRVSVLFIALLEAPVIAGLLGLILWRVW